MKDRLKQIRNTLGYSQAEIATKLGYELTTYRAFEYKSKNFPLEFLNALVAIFNININWLLTGHGDMFISTNENTLNRHDNSAIVKNLNSFYKRFNQLQKENDLNDYQMSKETGIAEARIEKLGIGKAIPTLEELNALKSHFDVSIDWLLYGESPCRNAQSDNTTLSADEISILKKLASKAMNN